VIPARGRGIFSCAKLILGLAFLAPWAMAGEPGVSPPSVGYASFVSWNYSQLPQLRAWKETERIIATTLAEGYPALRELQHVENGSPEQLKDFFRKLPDAPNQLTLVYLGGHQSPAGEWYFTDGTDHNWGELMEGLPKLRNPQRIVLLDCCYAQSASLWPDWSQKIAPACLFASPGNRPTPDLLVFWRRPVDWAELFPGASLWLRHHPFHDSDERITFFGLVWLEAWVKGTSPPRNLSEWSHLAQTMTQIAQHASTQIKPDAISNISSVFPP
jgi:hypothetical protein